MTPIAIDEHNLAPIKGLKPWVEPPPTKEDLAWATLETVDLRQLDSSDLSAKERLYAQTKKALTVDGFILVEGIGLSAAQIARQQAINQLLTTDTPLEEKQKHLADLAAGDYTGYKLKGTGGPNDQVEFFNLATKSYTPGYPLPSTIGPYIDEVREFGSHTRVLDLPDDYLWNLHDHNQPIGASSQRYMAYYLPDIQKHDDAVVQGHTDFNTISLLFNQPISALQILTPANEWQWVKYQPGTVVVNVADALDFLTGGVLKATRHRVVAPPKDQVGYNRYILINFARAKYDVELKPIDDSPLVQKEGTHAFAERVSAGGRAPTQGEWLAERIKGVQKRLGWAAAGDVKGKEEIYGKPVEYFD